MSNSRNSTSPAGTRPPRKSTEDSNGHPQVFEFDHPGRPATPPNVEVPDAYANAPSAERTRPSSRNENYSRSLEVLEADLSHSVVRSAPPDSLRASRNISQIESPLPAPSLAERATPASISAAAPAVGVDGIRLGGQPLEVGTVWSIELPPQPDEFSLDVELSNGLTIVVGHPKKHVDGRWFVVAKDAPNRRQLVARFQRHKPLAPHRHVLRYLGSPFATDLSSLLVLVLATLLVLPPTGLSEEDDEQSTTAASSLTKRFGGKEGLSKGGHPAPYTLSYLHAVLQALVHLLMVLFGSNDHLMTTHYALPDLLRGALLSAVLLAFCGRLLSHLANRFPPLSAYTLSIQPRLGVDDVFDDPLSPSPARKPWLAGLRSGLGGRKPSGLGGLTDEGESLMMMMTNAYKAAVVDVQSLPPALVQSMNGGLVGTPRSNNGSPPAADDFGIPSNGGAGNNGSSHNGSNNNGNGSTNTIAHSTPIARPAHRSGEIDLWVGPLLDAIEKSLGYGEIFGPLMVLAVKNDEGNLRKARKAWEKYSTEEEGVHKDRVATLRGLLTMENNSGIHRPGAVLCDPSAAIAILWMRRTLQFLGRCLQGILDDNETMGEVGANAYRMELEPYHGWLLKQTFSMALNGFPSREHIYLNIGSHLPETGDKEAAVKEEVRQANEQIQLVVESMRNLYEELGLEDMRKV